MYLLEISQASRSHPVGLFLTKEEAIHWIESIPYVHQRTDKYGDLSFTSYTMKYEELPVYEEILWKESVFPLSKYMFTPDDGPIILGIWEDLSVMNREKGYTKGMTQVDAYMIPNEEAKDYIRKREEIRHALTDYYLKRGQQVLSGGLGSEDGEYLILKKELFLHLDPLTVRRWDEKTSIPAFILEMKQSK